MPIKVVVDRVYVGPFMTSLDMAGVSLTLLRLQVAGRERVQPCRAGQCGDCPAQYGEEDK